VLAEDITCGSISVFPYTSLIGVSYRSLLIQEAQPRESEHPYKKVRNVVEHASAWKETNADEARDCRLSDKLIRQPAACEADDEGKENNPFRDGWDPRPVDGE
jgi:hypothetical protein